MGTRALRYLTRPQPIDVETDEAGAPVAVTIDGCRRRVDCIREEWLIEDQWWTEEPVARRCVDLVLEDGRQLDVHCSKGSWGCA
jgi:hypothetical protein